MFEHKLNSLYWNRTVLPKQPNKNFFLLFSFYLTVSILLFGQSEAQTICLGFEFSLSISFPMMITITQSVPPGYVVLKRIRTFM